MSQQSELSIPAALKAVYRSLSPHRRRQFYVVLALMLGGAIAELVALGAVFPFLMLLSNPGRALTIPLLGSLFVAVGAVTPAKLLLAAALLFVGTAIVAALVRIQLAWTSHHWVYNVGHEVAMEIQRRILYQPYLYHVSQSTSDIIASLQKVAIFVHSFLLQVMAGAISAVISVFIIATLFYIDWLVAVSVGILFAGIYGLVVLVSKRRLSVYSFEMADAYDKRVQMVQESLGGIRDIIVDKSQPIYLDAFRRIDKRLSHALSMVEILGVSPRFVIEAAGMVMIALVALVLAGRQGGLVHALPVLGALALGAQRLLPLLQQIYVSWNTSTSRKAVASDIVRLLQLPVPKDTAETRPEPLPFADRIVFAQVDFAYPTRADPVLADVSIEIPRGSRLALIGKTGSGKSTLVDLLMGLLEPTGGSIAVDGRTLTGPDKARWQANIAHVPQSIFLADTTIAQNIAFGALEAEFDLARVAVAARQAQLAEFIEGLPDGFHTRVGERGVQLSGGQRQRLGIARALYKKANVLILDEATSALDSATEAAVMEALDELGSPTVIMIAHRLSTVASCDQIVRLDRGRVVEIGSYAEVVGAHA